VAQRVAPSATAISLNLAFTPVAELQIKDRKRFWKAEQVHLHQGNSPPLIPPCPLSCRLLQALPATAAWAAPTVHRVQHQGSWLCLEGILALPMETHIEGKVQYLITVFGDPLTLIKC
jgi:hypothetical protein